MKSMLRIIFAGGILLSASSSYAFWGMDNNDWECMGPFGEIPGCNPYDEWDPRYWMEEMEQEFDDDDDYRYGAPYGGGYGGPRGPGYGGPGPYGPPPGYYGGPRSYGPPPGYAPAPQQYNNAPNYAPQPGYRPNYAPRPAPQGRPAQ